MLVHCDCLLSLNVLSRFIHVVVYISTSLLFFLIVIFYLFIYFYIYFWLCWVFVSVQGLSLVVASGGHSSSQCVGLFTIAASIVAEHRLQMRRLSSCGSRA